jgi:hypothetical protein
MKFKKITVIFKFKYLLGEIIVIYRPGRQKSSYAAEGGCQIHLVALSDQNRNIKLQE